MVQMPTTVLGRMQLRLTRNSGIEHPLTDALRTPQYCSQQRLITVLHTVCSPNLLVSKTRKKKRSSCCTCFGCCAKMLPSKRSAHLATSSVRACSEPMFHDAPRLLQSPARVGQSAFQDLLAASQGLATMSLAIRQRGQNEMHAHASRTRFGQHTPLRYLSSSPTNCALI